MIIRKYIFLLVLWYIFWISSIYATEEYSWHKFSNGYWNNLQTNIYPSDSWASQVCNSKLIWREFQYFKNTAPVETYKCLKVSDTSVSESGYTWHYMWEPYFLWKTPYKSIGSNKLSNPDASLWQKLCTYSNKWQIITQWGYMKQGYIQRGSYICQYTTNIISSKAPQCTWWTRIDWYWSDKTYLNTKKKLLKVQSGSWFMHTKIEECNMQRLWYIHEWWVYSIKENKAYCSCITTFEDEAPTNPPPSLPSDPSDPTSPTPTPPPTPSPVITTSTIDIPQSCESVTNTKTDWSTCDVQSVDINGKLICKQTATVTQEKGTHTWTCKKKYTYTDGVVTSEVWEDPTCLDETKQPACAVNHPIVTPAPAYSKLSFTLSPYNESSIDIFARGNMQSIHFPLSLSGATKENKPISLHTGDITNVQETSGFYADSINHTGVALSIEKKDLDTQKTVHPWEKIGYIALSSVAPVKTDAGKIEFDFKGYHFAFSNISYHFRKPGVGYILGDTTLGNTKKYFLGSYLDIPGNIAIAKRDISASDTSKFRLEDTRLGTKTGNWQELFTRVNSTRALGSLSDLPSLVLQPFRISYILDWENVSYYLSAKNDADDMTPITNTGQKFLWVKILWKTQKTGNTALTGANFSDLSTEKERTRIRQYAYKNIKNRTHNTVVW